MACKVLIIDDDELVCKTLSRIFTRMGYDACYQPTLKDGLAAIFSDTIDVVFLDVNLPDGNGLEAIRTIKKLMDSPEIIIFTGNEDADGAELAMRSRAWDYMSKRESNKKFQFALERALEYRKQKQAKPLEKTINRDTIIGESPQILRCLDDVARAANNDLPVLVIGETGTGKELFSKAIHSNSSRSGAGFVVVDCTALPEHLVESTLFGHVKGAFTGADSDRTGLMRMADKGTLFLDEVGELPISIQKKFLRALQEKKFRPVGAKVEVESNFRLICATHRDLKSMVKENKFREDLFFRLFSMTIHLPPLKDRKDDIMLIVQQYLARKEALSKEASFILSEDFIEELQLYEWPGNVRELFNTLDLICSDAGEGHTLFPHHLPGHIRAFTARIKFNDLNKNAKQKKLPGREETGNILTFKDYIESMKYAYLKELLATTRGDIQESCTLSGLSRSQIYRLMQQFDLKNS